MNQLSPAARLRAAIASAERPAVIVGAHNPVSASLIETAGFDGGWISSLEMSLVHGVEDRNLLGVREVADSIHYMRQAGELPLVVDADNGYGSVETTRRAVREFEAAGASAVCLEDSTFPKVNSFRDGDSDLLDVAEHQRRIEAAKSAQRDPDFLVIARTEAMIRGRGIDEAIRRGQAYVEAGADLILLHSREAGGEQALAAAAAWQSDVPLVTVPTAFPELTPAELHRHGFSLVIYANQVLRASVKAIQDLLQRVRDADRIEEGCVPMGDLFKLASSYAS
ncbi:isocitrate lyase/phosphoenolpyruvate mutase family protein [Streptantibioticus rubrisoli]|uniref:Isocitrate lyase/phosphoenolpyruvate mutase family protein n=1 Tax=Streptantibioticus rubrisoli TaxID=1387313 RepID=A0ABT1P926_9ACTN|nr:isocitrate lyase/phosphoenolpyruvate mutase family protein [Streptantibioticus rubrisoli]MCQ4041860.1 isocitrate lyase/phosphoenolpyruvate mutase family protein [Streptantibioticus rubrisoli]